MSLIPTDDANFVKDTSTNAVINTNVTAYQAYKMQRASSQSAEQMSKEITELKQEFGEIKHILGQLLQHVNSINR